MERKETIKFTKQFQMLYVVEESIKIHQRTTCYTEMEYECWCDTYIYSFHREDHPINWSIDQIRMREIAVELFYCIAHFVATCYTHLLFFKKRKRKIFYKIEITLMGNSFTAQKYGECVSMYLLHIIISQK